MKYLAIVAALALVGCQQVQPARPLIIVDNGYLRQYLWDGGDECGFVQGPRDSKGQSTLAGAHDQSLRYFVRFSDAVKWVEQFCPNAKEAN